MLFKVSEILDCSFVLSDVLEFLTFAQNKQTLLWPLLTCVINSDTDYISLCTVLYIFILALPLPTVSAAHIPVCTSNAAHAACNVYV